MATREFADMEHQEILLELTTTHYWKALKRELSKALQQYQARLLSPADSEFGLIQKEATSARYDALERFFRSIEQNAERYARE